MKFIRENFAGKYLSNLFNFFIFIFIFILMSCLWRLFYCRNSDDAWRNGQMTS